MIGVMNMQKVINLRRCIRNYFILKLLVNFKNVFQKKYDLIRDFVEYFFLTVKTPEMIFLIGTEKYIKNISNYHNTIFKSIQNLNSTQNQIFCFML